MRHGAGAPKAKASITNKAGRGGELYFERCQPFVDCSCYHAWLAGWKESWRSECEVTVRDSRENQTERKQRKEGSVRCPRASVPVNRSTPGIFSFLCCICSSWLVEAIF